MSPAPPRIFSTRRRKAAWARSLRRRDQTGAAHYVAHDMAEDAIERLSFMRFEPRRTLIIGDDAGLLTSNLGLSEIVHADPTSLDEEHPYPETGFDLIASFGTLATVNDLPGALIHLRNALADGGLMIAQFVGAGSLPRLRAAMLAADGDRPAARIHPAVDVRAGADLLQRAGFARQVADSRTLTVRYGSLDRLVSDLRDQALSNQLVDVASPITRVGLERARSAFLQEADSDHRATETFEILSLTGWKS